MSYQASDILEFWGKLLLQTSQGLQAAEQFSELLKNYLPESGTLNSSQSYNQTPATCLDWGSMVQAGLAVWGLAPPDPSTELETKCRELERKCAAQQEEIKSLRQTLDERGLGLEQAQREFQNILKRQGEQFEELIKGMRNQLVSGSDPKTK